MRERRGKSMVSASEDIGTCPSGNGLPSQANQRQQAQSGCRSVSSSAGAGVEGRSCWTFRQTESADSPIPLFSTSSRAIAVSMSSSPSIAWRPSEVNFPSMAKATRSFFPIKPETDFLHRALVGKELHLHGASLSDTPRATARLAQRVQ